MKIPFIEHRNWFFLFSLAVIVLGLIYMVVNSATGRGLFEYDVEFTGGTSFQVDMGKPFNNNDVAALVTQVTGVTDPQIQKLSDNTNANMVEIKVKELDQDTRAKLIDQFSSTFGVDKQSITYSDFSPTVSSEMQKTAILALVVSCVLMLIYISFRFRNVRMGGAAIASLLHDAIIVVVAYGVLRIPLSYSFIAVVLTVIGYSINATIVIFDRIRENRPNMKKQPVAELIDHSVTQTMRRSVYTTTTVFIALLCLYILGVVTIKQFSLPLLIGVVFGGYSSVCLSSSFWYVFLFGPKGEKFKAPKQKAGAQSPQNA